MRRRRARRRNRGSVWLYDTRLRKSISSLDGWRAVHGNEYRKAICIINVITSVLMVFLEVFELSPRCGSGGGFCRQLGQWWAQRSQKGSVAHWKYLCPRQQLADEEGDKQASSGRPAGLVVLWGRRKGEAARKTKHKWTEERGGEGVGGIGRQRGRKGVGVHLTSRCLYPGTSRSRSSRG